MRSDVIGRTDLFAVRTQKRGLPADESAGIVASVNTEQATIPRVDEIPRPDVSHLLTEDDTPVENPFCEKQMRLLTAPLYASWKPGVPFVAMANVGLYFSLNSPVLVPDTLVSVGVEQPENLLPKEHRAYFHWLYGKAPDVVVELVSNREGDERDRKMRSYAVHGVPYYVVYDPEAHIQEPALQCFQLDHSGSEPRYLPLAKAVFPSARLGLVEWDGEFETRRAPWIRWVDEDGNLILTGDELAARETRRADAERARAESAQRRADSEQRRANSEQRRADLLAEKLRALGADPDSVNGA